MVNGETFWKNPDLSLASVRVKLGVNRVTGSYVLYINHPVKKEFSAKFHNWQVCHFVKNIFTYSIISGSNILISCFELSQGPTLILSLPGMRSLAEYLQLVRVSDSVNMESE